MKVTIREKKTKEGKSLYLDIYHKGKRKYEFLGLFLTSDREKNKEVKRLANKVRLQRELELQYKSLSIQDDKKSKSDFFIWMKGKINNRRTYKALFQHLKIYSGEKLLFDEIDNIFLEGFKKYLSSNLHANTAYMYFAFFKALLTQAVKEEIIKENPAAKIDNLKQLQTKREFLTLEEINLLAKTPCKNEETKKAFLFACLTGLRISDIELLTYQNIKNGMVEFRQKKTKNLNYIPLSETALKLAEPISTKGMDSVFKLPSRAYIGVTLKVWFAEAGIMKNANFHLSRHTFATLALTQGIDIYTVSKLLGHKELSTTQIYSQIIDQKKMDAIKLMPKIEGIN